MDALFGGWPNSHLHVDGSEPLGLIDEGPLVLFIQLLPLRSQPFTNLRIVHFWILLGHFSSLTATPYHKGIHRTFYPEGRIVLEEITVECDQAGRGIDANG